MMIGKDMGLDIKRYTPRLLANSISNLKNELIDPATGAGQPVRPRSPKTSPTTWRVPWPQVVHRIPAVGFGSANALDFDDLIGETVAVLQAFPQIAAPLSSDASGTS